MGLGLGLGLGLRLGLGSGLGLTLSHLRSVRVGAVSARRRGGHVEAVSDAGEPLAWREG